MARRGVLGLMAASSAGLLAGCDPFVRSSTYRFKMTVEVQTAQGMKSGSSVMQVVADKGSFKLGDTTGNGAGLRGEAVVVDLPNGPVFALLTMGDGKGGFAGPITEALSPGAKGQSFDDMWAAVRKLAGASDGEYRGELPSSSWPIMVRFRDLNDPKSVEKVDPSSIGVKRIWLETTEGEMTVGIEKRLGWLNRNSIFFEPGPGYDPYQQDKVMIAQEIEARFFSTELPK